MSQLWQVTNARVRRNGKRIFICPLHGCSKNLHELCFSTTVSRRRCRAAVHHQSDTSAPFVADMMIVPIRGRDFLTAERLRLRGRGRSRVDFGSRVQRRAGWNGASSRARSQPGPRPTWKVRHASCGQDELTVKHSSYRLDNRGPRRALGGLYTAIRQYLLSR